MNINNKKRFIELDGIRGIAVMFVLLSHYTWAYDYHFKILGEHLFYFIYGDYGVQIFFIISGFVIFMTLDHSKSTSNFVISRFSRLYPTYWVCIITTIIIISLFPTPTLGNYSISTILINFSMIQSYLKFSHIDQVYWSLAVELAFYFLMGTLFFFKQMKYIEIYSIIWLIFSFISLVFDFKFENYLKVFFILEWAPLFITGMMLYKIKFKNSTLMNHLLILISLVLYLFILHEQIINRNQVDETILHYILIIFAYFIFYFLAFKELNILKNKYLQFLGYISYPLYLLHNVIGYAIIYKVKQFYDNQFFYILLTTIVSVILALLVTKTMEEPSNKIKHKLYSFIKNKEKI